VDLTDPAVAWGRCLIESQQHVADTRDHGGTARYVRVTGLDYPGREHWAVLTPDPGDDPDDPTAGTVTDLTARQFDPTAPAPWTGTLDDWLDDACEWLQDGLQYAVFDHFGDETPVFADRWVREEITPGPLTFRPLDT
jgi:hypothetical protein